MFFNFKTIKVQGITDEVLQYFISYDWPGNVRELQHMIEEFEKYYIHKVLEKNKGNITSAA
jgi:transcriptional regulator with PAS, ATPase and Fis domain